MFLHIACLYQKTRKLLINWYAPVFDYLAVFLRRWIKYNPWSSVLISVNENDGYYAECSYPRGKGDGIGALYISELCQSTSSGLTLPSSFLPYGIILVSNMCIGVCITTFLQLPDSMKQSQAELYLETYQVLDLEMSRLREIQRWQASAASKVRVCINLGFYSLSWLNSS